MSEILLVLLFAPEEKSSWTQTHLAAQSPASVACGAECLTLFSTKNTFVG